VNVSNNIIIKHSLTNLNFSFQKYCILIVGGKNKIFFPTYLPAGQIVESERGSKEYFHLGLEV
jgi:hypothetical protein